MRVERPGRSLPPGRISLDQALLPLYKLFCNCALMRRWWRPCPSTGPPRAGPAGVSAELGCSLLCRWGAGEISQQYKLNKQTVTSILQHYELFNMMVSAVV